jgi:membrane-associated phospholipid phosphatase
MTTDVEPRPRQRVARLLTELLQPVLVTCVLLLVIAVHAEGGVRGALTGLVAVLFTGVIPYGFLVLRMRGGQVGDRHVWRRQERPVVLGFGVASLLAGLLVLTLLGAPRELFALLAAIAATTAVALGVTFFWKISIHAACVAGSVAALGVVFGPPGLLSLPAVAAVGWSRVALRDHTTAQVVAGSLLGFAAGGAVQLTLG